MRSVPKPSAGHGLSAASQSVAECVKLGLVLRELQAFGLDLDLAARGNNGHFAPFAWAA
jgi:hypothetical protein